MSLRHAALLLALSLVPALAAAQPVVELEVEAPDEEWVWEDGYFKPDGTLVEGFYRQRAREGFEWVPGHLEGEVWVDPQWRWIGPPRQGYVLVTGHVGTDRYWVPEVWRPVTLANHEWVDGRWDGNVWIVGHWRPRVATRPGFVWEPGHWAPTGEWIEGHWRPENRTGFVWVPGRFRFGVWIPGTWQPVEVRPGWVWAAGYWGPNGWVDGQWREARRAGHTWVPGHWRGNVWVQGAWVAGARPARRFVARPVDQMIRARRAHIRRIQIGAAVEARGRAVEARGRAIEQRGQRLEIRGELRGNARMERRGEAMQNRGELVQKRGRRIEQRGGRVRRGH